MKTDDQGAIQTNTGAIRLILHQLTGVSGIAGDTNNTTDTGSVTARGFESSNVLLFPDTDTVQEGEVFVGTSTPAADTAIVGNRNDVVLAKIVNIEDVNPAADGSNVPQGTSRTIAEFKFTAATNINTLNGRNKATLSGLVFQISATNVLFDNSEFDLCNKNDQTQQISCTAYNRAGGPTTDAGSGTQLIDCRRSDNTSVDL